MGANGVQRILGPALLDEADRRVDDHDAENDHRVHAVAEQEGDQRRNEQDIDQQVVDMGEEPRGKRARLAGRQTVRPVHFEPLRSLGGRQSFGG
jgi:hypothetical protein